MNRTRLIPLDKRLIEAYWHQQGFDYPTALHLFSSIDSTNQFLKTGVSSSASLDICCAEQQTKGRGRFGRTWHSPFGENIYCSSRWPVKGNISHLSGLSLVMSLATLQSIKKIGIDIPLQIKWPNDLFYTHKKLGGCLIEITADKNTPSAVIVGIGLNVNGIEPPHPSLSSSWCSLNTITGQDVDRNILIARLMMELKSHFDTFQREGLGAFLGQWQAVDYLAGQWVTVSQPNGALHGKACGINTEGQLCLKDPTGTLHYLSSGDTSMQFS